ncbi:phosphoadenylyl-sulfate reductase [Jannaschia aquimarina]|uniref:Adenosine 5'-phosphosulfate reductase n=1 Tax=Jannaschia aquimarina TaxID=935700 RepID=A0A0D1EM48_9RHOB|nr:phosphoadenylyl-sulfate reductase [Jannaschia aquimarina]KIT18056.1 Phosphoadenosine phosphosulfate reductase [Jannaschia aquimarina]SNS89430.1 phosphoadenylylsulfate reductase (thioredoxin) [Jannaschia aquimarina]
MPLDLHALRTAQAAELNGRFAHAPAEDVLRATLDLGDTALVSSFGADSVVLLHMAAAIDPSVPVLFLETGMLFAETLTYQREVAETLGLTEVRLIRPSPEDLFLHDPEGDLHGRDPDLCCTLRKVRPLELALQGFDAWVTGRKRVQGAARAGLPIFEVEGGRIKANPLAAWSGSDLAAYMDTHALPRHPLVAQGYPSIGCAPCTSKVAPGEDPRSGRWRGREKTECGIHFAGGVVVRPDGTIANKG